MAKRSLILGITGQLGRYLAELLLEKGHKVYGLIRRTSLATTSRISHLLNKIEIISGDITDQHSLIEALNKSQPEEVYNLAAQSLVPCSFDQPILTAQVTGLGVLNILSAIKLVNPKIKFVQSSSSEMFGSSPPLQNELTPFKPRSPYAVAKVFGYYMTVNYRESYDMFCSNSICFNLESPHRGVEFVTRKITDGIKKIIKGEAEKLHLGNLDSCRDWSFAGDSAKAIYAIMQHNKPDDFCIGTGEMHSIKEFLEIAFDHVNLNWQNYVIGNDPRYLRPAEVPALCADTTKIRQELKWQPEYSFNKLVKLMLDSELNRT